jgi:ABC-2 type transport system ATP-binding protein
VTAAIETAGLTKRYGRRVALSECALSIPTGKIVGLGGPNGAGKTTLLHLAVGLLEPSAGSVEVLGHTPAEGPEQLGRVGFVAQNMPLYAAMSVADHLHLGGWVNPTWDRALAEQRIEHLGLDPRQKAGTLSGGQRAQLARPWASPSGPSC